MHGAKTSFLNSRQKIRRTPLCFRSKAFKCFLASRLRRGLLNIYTCAHCNCGQQSFRSKSPTICAHSSSSPLQDRSKSRSCKHGSCARKAHKACTPGRRSRICENVRRTRRSGLRMQPIFPPAPVSLPSGSVANPNKRQTPASPNAAQRVKFKSMSCRCGNVVHAGNKDMESLGMLSAKERSRPNEVKCSRELSAADRRRANMSRAWS